MPYNIAFLSKYPPLEGGIAAKTYWMARGLAARGHTIHVITHGILTGGNYQIQDCKSSSSRIPGLQVHRTPDELPWHIPEDNEYSLALLDLTARVIRERGIQIIDTGYLVPYGIVGHLAKMLTGVRHVVRHGGSDLEKFLKKKILGTIVNEAISSADMVVTEIRSKNVLGSLNRHLVCQPAYVADETVFITSDGPRPRWRVATIGKINFHWQHKSLHYIAKIMARLIPQFECWVVGQGNGFANFQQSLSGETSSSFKWYPFVPPWEMPRLFNQLDAIFVFESKLPHPAVSNLVLEAACSGVGIITDRPDFAETYRDITALNKNQVLVVSPTEAYSSAEMIAQWIRERVNTKLSSHQLVSFQEYLSSNERIYADVLNRGP